MSSLSITSNFYDYYAEEGYTTDALDSRGAWWWLRSPGDTSSSACDVRCGGDAGADASGSVNVSNVGVRPALYLEF